MNHLTPINQKAARIVRHVEGGARRDPSRDAGRVVALQDLNLKLGHAVLVVYVGEEPMLLDNQIAAVVPANSIRHYLPVFSIFDQIQ